MALVRVMREGKPKYIRNDTVTAIHEGGAPDESPFCLVSYENDNTITDEEVDGTPDEVYKALLNPPETVLKADVARFFDALDDVMQEARYGRPIMDFTVFLERFRRDLGVERKR